MPINSRLSHWLKVAYSNIILLTRELLSKKVKFSVVSQPVITCSKLTKETLEQGMKYVQR